MSENNKKNIEKFVEWVELNLSTARTIIKPELYSVTVEPKLKFSLYHNGDEIVDGKIDNAYFLDQNPYGFAYCDIFHHTARIRYDANDSYEIDCGFFSEYPSEEEYFQYCTVADRIPDISQDLFLRIVRIAKLLDSFDEESQLG